MPTDLDVLFRAFHEGRGEQVWPDFLDRCGGAFLQVARSVARDEDEAADAFVFVCERLAANQFARLRRFDPELKLGVRRDDTGVVAHAWLEIDGHSLDPTSDQYQELPPVAR